MSTDALSDVLSAVRLSGSVFFDVTAKSPWVAEAPPAAQIANEVTPGAQHAIEYHVVTRGSCWISLIGDAGFEPVKLEEGDIAVIPHGDPHVISSAPGMRAEPNLDMHRRPEDSNALPFALRTGGEGASDTHVICGFFSCDARPFNPLLDSLPRFMRLRRDASSSVTKSARPIHPFRHRRDGQQTRREPKRAQPAVGTDVRRGDPVAYGSACEQQHRLARGIA